MIKIFVVIFLITTYQANAQNSISFYNDQLKKHNQVVYVTVPQWNATQGIMRLYERKNENKAWQLMDSFIVVVGRSGLGIDKNKQHTNEDSIPIKQEGDGRSPSGIYKLGPIFSYHQLSGLHMLYKQVDSTDICVDDMNSALYNTWVDTDTTHKDWNSFEYLHRKDSLYEYGVWVNYNADTIFAGNGSCIFLHVWGGENSTTSGCTAMDKQNLLKLIHWLDEEKHPVLLQVVQKN